MGIGAGLYMYDVVIEKFTFAIASPDEFLCKYTMVKIPSNYLLISQSKINYFNS